MPSNMVDTARNIPIIIERNMPQPMAVDDETGFPFDKDVERDSSFRNQLDDIAKRHPELAGHFEGFPFRTNSLGRRSHQQQQQPDEPDDSFPRFTNRDRPFGSRFEQFGFPFTRDGSPFATTQDQSPKYHHPPQQSPQHPSQTTQTSPNSTQQQQQTYSADPQNVASAEDCQSAEKPPQAPERGRRQQNLQQSNTADLTQKQEAVNDRNQRSMSAPPPESRSQPRYVSSINIPIQRDHPAAGDTQSSPQGNPQQQQPQPQPQQSFKPTERVIPIHVEGRDEPVMPKNVHQTYAQPSPHPTSYAHPEPEHIFGGRNMGDFMGRNAGRFPTREDVFGRQYQMPPEQQRFQQQKQQTPPKTYPVPPQQQQVPPQQHQQQQQQQQQQHQQNVPPQQNAHPQPEMQHQNQEQQHQQQPQQPQQNQKPSPIDQIKAIQKDVSELMAQVDQFTGAPKDKQYLYLDEMLTRNLIKLDNIDTQGQENIRSARREAIKCIEKCIGILESKANANVAAKDGDKGEKMEVDQKPETQPENDAKSDGKSEAKSDGQEQQQTMEAEVSSTSSEAQQVAEQGKSVEPMEVAPTQTQGPSEQEGNAEQAKESAEASAKGDAAPAVQLLDNGKLEGTANQANGESSEAVAATNESKMEVETEKPATEGSDDKVAADGKDQAQPDSSSQVKEEPKDENKKEKKKGKKKEKTEKK